MDFKEIRARYDEYRNLLSDLRSRVKSNRDWYRQEQTEFRGADSEKPGVPRSTSGHIFNAIQYKHADLMDNYPYANILPREKSDEEGAKVLTEVLPYILERCGFRQTFCLNLYNKLISGTSIYGVFYNPKTLSGGDIEIKEIDILNFAWQPDAVNLEESRFVFYDSFIPEGDFVTLYGELPNIAVQVQYDEQKDVQPEEVFKTVVVTDCYYKKLLPDGRKVLHFVKFSGDEILFCSEDEKGYEKGFYAHGMYPFALDILNPVPGEICGFGLVDVAKNQQAYIDRLDFSINRHAMLSSAPRYLFQENSGISDEEFLDVSKSLVKVRGSVDEAHFRRIDVPNLPEFVVAHRENKIEELKEICGNRDFSQGGSSGGVTSGSAITALQNASDKLVRDAVNFSYIAFEKIVRLVIELIREFYAEPRVFRIVGDDGTVEFREVMSSGLFVSDEPLVYDISVSVEKNNPYSRAFHNQLIMELMGAGLLNPQNFKVASIVLKNLNFDGKDKLIRDLSESYEALNKTVSSEPAGSVGGGSPMVQIPLGDSGSDEALSGASGSGGPLVEIPLG